jgi:peptidoglycan/LPS O-acetylase OafA/YrhL
MLDLRLLGVGLTLLPTSAVERGARPWLIAALMTMVASGVLIGISEALKLYDKQAFWVKMAALLAAVIFTFAVKLPQARRDVTGRRAQALGTASIALWLTVALAGRWIGFS